jgi:hypothetical protein
MKKAEMKIVTFLVFLGVLSANFISCTKNYTFETADQVIGKTTVNRNRMTNVTTVKGPYAETPDKDAMYLLTARYKNKQFISCQLVIYQTRIRQRGPAYYYQAFDLDGNKMELSRFVDTFSDSDEKVGITITKERLKRSRDTGMGFKLFGKRDELSLRVEPFYIQGFLAKAQEAG